MDIGRKRLLLVVGAISAGIFAGFFLWSLDSQYTYAALIPFVGGLLLGLPAVRDRAVAKPKLGQVAGIVAWLALTVAIVLGAESPRPVGFFWSIGAAMGLFLVSAALYPKKAWHAAAGLVVVFVLVRWSSYHAFATFGGGDGFRHMRIIEAVILTEQKAPLELAAKYFAAPGFHLAAAAVRLVTGLGRSDAMFWTVLVAQLSLPLGIYAFTRRWGPGIGPAAALAVLATESGLVFGGLHPIPGGLALSLMLPLVVGLQRRDGPGVFLLALAGLAGILTHHLTIIVALACIGAYSVWSAFHAVRKPSGSRRIDFVPLFTFVVLIVVFLLIHAVLAPRGGVDFYQTTIDNLSQSTETATPGAGEDLTLSERTSIWSGFLYKATLVLASALVVAAGSRLMTEPDRKAQALGLAALVTLLMSFAVPFLGIDLVADRWLPVVFVFGLFGVGALVTPWSNRTKNLFALGIVGFALLGITQPNVTHDHFFYSAERNLAIQFNEPEIVAASLATTSNVTVYTDVAMVHLFRVFGGGAIQVNLMQVNGTASLPPITLVVIRTDLLEAGRLHFELARGTQRFALAEDPSDGLPRRLDLTSRVTDTGAVQTYFT